jgi:hypothetical protein
MVANSNGGLEIKPTGRKPRLWEVTILLMFFLFSVGSDTEDLGPMRATTCPNCHNARDWHLYRQRMKVGAFFINFLTVQTKYVLACPICRMGKRMDKTQAENWIRANRGPRNRDSR